MKLAYAVICLDCEEIFDIRDKFCPMCGRDYYYPVTSFISDKKDKKSEVRKDD